MFAGDMRNSDAMSATAVLAKPSRRNSASAVAMMRSRVSSGLGFVLGWAFIAGVTWLPVADYSSGV
jgi:hypothetical protein